jgi:hypothetical protein
MLEFLVPFLQFLKDGWKHDGFYDAPIRCTIHPLDIKETA